MGSIVARNPTTGEVEKAAETAAKAFPNLSLEHWQQDFHLVARVFGERFILVGELDGEIVSSLLCHPSPIYRGSSRVSHSAVGAVGTVPEHRRKGCAGALMTECVRMLSSEGICLSSLWPFSFEYYRKFGWEVGAEERRYEAEGRVFAGLKGKGKTRAAGERDIPGIKALYDSFAPRFNCLTVRSDEWWSEIVELPRLLGLALSLPGNGTLVCEDAEGPAAYAVYKMSAAESGTRIDIKELAWREIGHRREILRFLGSLDPEARIRYTAPAGDLFLAELPNPDAVECRAKASFAFRVVDPAAAIESLVPDTPAHGEFTLSIDDPVFSRGFEFGVVVDGDRAALAEPGRGGSLRMSVQTLAQLYSGRLGLMAAFELGLIDRRRVNSESVAAAAAVFGTAHPYRTGLEPG